MKNTNDIEYQSVEEIKAYQEGLLHKALAYPIQTKPQQQHGSR